MVLPAISAILGILAFLPSGYSWIFGLIYLAPFFIFLNKENNLLRLIAGAFVFRFIFMSGAVYFAFEPLTWMASILIFLGLPIFAFLLKRAPLLILIFSSPFIWTFFDHLQARYSPLPAYIMTAGNSLGSSPFLGLGAFGLGAMTLFAALIGTIAAEPFILKTKKAAKASIIIMASLVVGAALISKYELQKNAAAYANLKNSLKIAAVSANAKFDQNSFTELENEIRKESAVDLLVFPENILKNQAGPDFFQNLAKKLNINLTVSLDAENERNKAISSLMIDNDGKIIGVHDKARLTFMGEYWPFGTWRPFYLDWLKNADPKIRDYAVFNPEKPYVRGQKNLLALASKGDSVNFASLICLEIHYPSDLKKYKKNGVEFFINPTGNRWIGAGLNHFLFLTKNLRKIESVWLKTPIVSSGMKDFAGVITPDGKTDFVGYESKNKNYGLFAGEIRY